MGWDNEASARQHLGMLGEYAKQDTVKVIHHTKTSVVKVADVNLATHRHSAVVESHKVVDGINVFELKDTLEALKYKLSKNV